MQKQAGRIDDIMSCISRAAPVVVEALADAGDAGYVGPDRDVFAGQLILDVAETATAESWPEDEFDAKARTRALAYLAQDGEAGLLDPLEAEPLPCRREPIARAEVMDTLARLDSLRLKILALILQEGLSINETAAVLDLPQWRVKQECASAVGQIHERSCA